MPKKPQNTTKSPAQLDGAVDVFGEILEAVHLKTAIFGKLDLGTPWRLKLPPRDYLSFYVVARGNAWLEFPKATRSAHAPGEIGRASCRERVSKQV